MNLTSPARWYLLHAGLLTGALGIGALFYNLTIDALGYERIFLGRLETLARLAALLLLLPLWWLVHRIGLRQALLLSAGLHALSTLAVALWPAAAPLLLASAATGPAAVLFQVSAAPLMMAHSGSANRDTLFSLNAALNIGVAGVSKWLGGLLPALFARSLDIPPDSALAYRATFGVVGLLLLSAMLPLLMIPRREPQQPAAASEPQVLAETSGTPTRTRLASAVARLLAPIARRLPEPWRSVVSDPLPLLLLLLPPLVISLGAALLIPYLNIFFVERYRAGSTALGLIFALSDVAAGLAMLAAPLLAARLGKIGAIALTQLLSIPFLLLTGFAPGILVAGFALVLRAGLFNLGVPLYDAFAMERSPAAARPIAIGLVNGAYAAGYLVAPTISTSVQQSLGFAPLFVATAICYGVAGLTMLALFGSGRPRSVSSKR
ncbi:MAG TPA: MFS transporter [Roseiflexaceae bacterium]|nr:MFS transporter [Roseiflexaceae bacterium]